MVLYAKRKAPLAARAVAAIGLLALGVLYASGAGRAAPAAQASSDGGQQQAVGSNERLRGLMTERYEILKKIVESLDRLMAAGMTDLPEWRDGKVALYMAKADLAADAAGRIKVHEEMVDFLREAEQLAKRRADSGRLPDLEMDRARLATIEAQMALERLRMSRPQ